jgi:cysteinyl-tRNA synthetase
LISLYNSQTKQKAPFIPLDPYNVRMYVCGPTVYDYAHIGNARPVVVFDILFRLLRHTYGHNHVTYARNITDVDDKIMVRAKEENISIQTLTERTTEFFHEDMDALGALRPTIEPRATEHIHEMITLIEKLIENGHAYANEGHVLFHVPSMPDYGQLSGRSLKDMIAGARVEIAPYKKDPTDFVLWKPSSTDQVGWTSPWGFGRPGWHIECSAMSWKWLGETFDIHGGGIDLIFPHHENEIAQSCCAHGKPYVNVWMHNGFLQIEGQKMSKSLGNFFTVHDLRIKEKLEGEVIRLTLLRTHYRQPLDWTKRTVEESKILLDKWYRLLDKTSQQELDSTPLPLLALEALNDDLNSPLVFSRLNELSDAEIIVTLQFMGFLQKTSDAWFKGNDEGNDFIKRLIEERNKARKDRNFAEADRIRKALLDQGITLEDTAEGTVWRRI